MITLKRGSRGNDVKTLQTKLNLAVDGIFGVLTEEAVKEFQQVHNLAVDGIVGPRTWAAVMSTTTTTSVGDGVYPITGKPTTRRYIDEIIIHYSATPLGENYTVEQIKQAHLARGFNNIGYHWYIDLNGKIWKGRDENISGAHCTGHNTRSIGICYCGGCPSRKSRKDWMNVGLDTRTPAQKAALIKIVSEEKRKYPKATVHGHREFANKPCPGFDANKEYKNL